MTDIAAALKRVEKVVLRSPQTGIHPDAPATARWTGGTKVTSTHANGTQFATDLPQAVGGEDSAVTPGWLLRAGLASCVATRIAMAAAEEGIELSQVEVVATSISDVRGLLDMVDAAGARVSAGPRDVQLHVKIAAADATRAERLRLLVERSNRCSPVSCAVQELTPIGLQIEIV
ncbi:MAG: OsmC family protein [Proteobacteria bacterium]|nr:OsmC family protein [Pseudomonadota bacterium]